MLIRQGDTGQDVGRIHQKLIEAGLLVDVGELGACHFGQSTYDAVRQFQATHVGIDGNVLREDGVVGPATLWALMHGAESQKDGRFTAPGWRCFPSEARAELVPVLEWAMGWIGLRELPSGSNRGEQIDEWARAAGLEPGLPWCALFVSAAYHRCPLDSPFGWKASAYKLLEWAKANKRLVMDEELEPGDVFLILRMNFHGHVGLIAGPALGGEWATIEGNSGDAVRGLVRARESFTAVVRPLVR